MNRSEKICFEWIKKKKGYSEDDIFFQSSKSPDFKCKDGITFEAKNLYNDKIIFWNTQIEHLKDCSIVVVDLSKEKVILDFKWEDRNKIKYPKIKIVTITRKSITMKPETQEELIRRKIKQEGKLHKNITWDEFLLEATHE